MQSLFEFPIHRFSLDSIALPLLHPEKSPRPAILEHLPKPPREIHIQGATGALALLDRLPTQGLAVVGTRAPQSRSLEAVDEVIRALAGTELIVLSGLARGIDARAHRAALQAGLPTIAILGSSLDSIYPRENAGLAREILEAGGLLITEHAEGTPLRKHHFLDRNRMIAVWSKATWIVEAGFRSGALNTAKWARENGGDCYSTPCYPGDVALAGNQSLLHDGAFALWDVRDLGQTWSRLRNLNPKRHGSVRKISVEGGTSDAEQLRAEVQARSCSQGGIRVEELLDCALAWNWDPQRFFLALQTALNDLQIYDSEGILNASQTHDT